MATWEVGMELSERHVNGVSIIDVSGDLIVPAENPRELREKVLSLLQRGERRIVLNVANLQHMDSSFVGEIVATYKATISTGGVLRLAQVGPHLRNVLRTTTLDKIFTPYDTEAEALASFVERV
jgi:anti-sigma B factor antagonist